MKVSPEGIKEFQTIAREDYGIELSEGEASVEALRLLLFYEMIYRSLPSELKATQLSADPPASHPEQEAH